MEERMSGDAFHKQADRSEGLMLQCWAPSDAGPEASGYCRP